MATETGRVAWHELLATDVEAAQAFYRQLLGWEIDLWKPEQADYPMIRADGSTHGGFQRTHPDRRIPAHWIPYVTVADTDATAARARELGGTLRVEPLDVRDVGRIAILQDREGAEIAALTPASEQPRPEGVFVWDELLADDVDAASSFYAQVFDWRADEADGSYTLFQVDGEPVAGLTKRPAAVPEPTWLSYVATDGIDATVRRAGDLGATVVVDVTESEGVGRWAAIIDPLGAPAGLLEQER